MGFPCEMFSKISPILMVYSQLSGELTVGNLYTIPAAAMCDAVYVAVCVAVCVVACAAVCSAMVARRTVGIT